jgi:hypothetical protein
MHGVFEILMDRRVRAIVNKFDVDGDGALSMVGDSHSHLVDM